MQASAAALWINAFFYGFDTTVTEFVHKLYDLSAPFFQGLFDFISFLGKDGIILILLSIVLTLFRKTRKVGIVMLLGLAIGALFTNCCLKVLIARPRPYMDSESLFYKYWLVVGQRVESDKSFPSGHTTAAFAAMTGVFLTCNKKYSWTAFIFAFLMGIARIYLCVHFPSDVLAGVIVGVVSSIIAYWISKKLPEKIYESDFLKKKKHGLHEK